MHYLFETVRIQIHIKQLDPDQYQIEKQDPDPYQSFWSCIAVHVSMFLYKTSSPASNTFLHAEQSIYLYPTVNNNPIPTTYLSMSSLLYCNFPICKSKPFYSFVGGGVVVGSLMYIF